LSDRPCSRFIRWPNLSFAEGSGRDAANLSSVVCAIRLTDPNVLRTGGRILQNLLGRTQVLIYGSVTVRWGGGTGGFGRGCGHYGGLQMADRFREKWNMDLRPVTGKQMALEKG